MDIPYRNAHVAFLFSVAILNVYLPLVFSFVEKSLDLSFERQRLHQSLELKVAFDLKMKFQITLAMDEVPVLFQSLIDLGCESIFSHACWHPCVTLPVEKFIS